MRREAGVLVSPPGGAWPRALSLGASIGQWPVSPAPRTAEAPSGCARCTELRDENPGPLGLIPVTPEPGLAALPRSDRQLLRALGPPFTVGFFLSNPGSRSWDSKVGSSRAWGHTWLKGQGQLPLSRTRVTLQKPLLGGGPGVCGWSAPP